MSIKVDLKPNTAGVDNALRRISQSIRGVNRDVAGIDSKLSKNKQLKIDTKVTQANLRGVETQLNQLNTTVTSTVNSMQKAFVALGVAVTAAFAFRGVTSGLNRASDAMVQYENRIKLVTGSTEEAIRVQKDLQRIARDTYSSMDVAIQTFNRFGLSLQNTEKYNLNDLLVGFEKGTLGASNLTGEVNGLATSLSRAESAGKDFQGVLAKTPKLVTAIQDQLSLTPEDIADPAELKRYAADIQKVIADLSEDSGGRSKLLDEALRSASSSLYEMEDAGWEMRDALADAPDFAEKLATQLGVGVKDLDNMAKNASLTSDAIKQTFDSMNRYSTADLLKVTEVVQQSVAISGGSLASAEAAVIQLGQGLASGQLRGEELNSVLEQTPRLAQAIAAGMNIPFTELRDAAKDGQVTAETVMSALLSQADEIDAEFKTLEKTTAQAAAAFWDAFRPVLAGIDAELGFSAAYKRNLERATDYLTNNQEQILATVAQVHTSIRDQLSAIANYIRTVVDYISSLVNRVAGLLPYLDPVLDKVKSLARWFVTLLKSIGGFMSGLREVEAPSLSLDKSFTDNLSALGDNIKAMAGTYGPRALSFLTQLSTSIKELGAAYLPRVLAQVEDFAKGVEHSFWWIYDKVIGNSWWTDLMVETKELADKYLDATLTKVKSFAGSVSTAFQSIYDKGRDALSFITIESLPSLDDILGWLDSLATAFIDVVGNALSTAWKSLSTEFPILGAFLALSVTRGLLGILTPDFGKKFSQFLWGTYMLTAAVFFLEKLGGALLDSGILKDAGTAVGAMMGGLMISLVQTIPTILGALMEVSKGFVSGFLDQLGLVGKAIKVLFSAPGGGLISTLLFGAGVATLLGQGALVGRAIRSMFNLPEAKKNGPSLVEMLLFGPRGRMGLAIIAGLYAITNVTTDFFNGIDRWTNAALGLGAIPFLLYGSGGLRVITTGLETIYNLVVKLVGGTNAVQSIGLFDRLFGGPRQSPAERALTEKARNLRTAAAAAATAAEAAALTNKAERFEGRAALLAGARNSRFAYTRMTPEQRTAADVQKLVSAGTNTIGGLFTDLLGHVDTARAAIAGVFSSLRTRTVAMLAWVSARVGAMGLIGRIILPIGAAALILAATTAAANAATDHIAYLGGFWATALPLGLIGAIILGPKGVSAISAALSRIPIIGPIKNLVGGALSGVASFASTAIVAMATKLAVMAGLTAGAALAATVGGLVVAGGLLAIMLFGEGDSLWDKVKNTGLAIRRYFTGVTNSTRTRRRDLNSLNETKQVGSINTDLAKALSSINLGALNDRELDEIRKVLTRSESVFRANAQVYETEGALTRGKIDETNRALAQANAILADMANRSDSALSNTIRTDIIGNLDISRLAEEIGSQTFLFSSSSAKERDDAIDLLRPFVTRLTDPEASDQELARALVELTDAISKLPDDNIIRETISADKNQAYGYNLAANPIIEPLLRDIRDGNPVFSNNAQLETMVTAAKDQEGGVAGAVDPREEALRNLQHERNIWAHNRLDDFDSLLKRTSETMAEYETRIRSMPLYQSTQDLGKPYLTPDDLRAQVALSPSQRNLWNPEPINSREFLDNMIKASSQLADTATAQRYLEANSVGVATMKAAQDRSNYEIAIVERLQGIGDAFSDISQESIPAELYGEIERRLDARDQAIARLTEQDRTDRMGAMFPASTLSPWMSEGMLAGPLGADLGRLNFSGSTPTAPVGVGRVEELMKNSNFMGQLTDRLEETTLAFSTGVKLEIDSIELAAEQDLTNLLNLEPVTVPLVPGTEDFQSKADEIVHQVTSIFDSVQLPSIDFELLTPERLQQAQLQLNDLTLLKQGMDKLLSSPITDEAAIRDQFQRMIEAHTAFSDNFVTMSDRVAAAAMNYSGEHALIDSTKMINLPDSVNRALIAFADAFTYAKSALSFFGGLGFNTTNDAKAVETAETANNAAVASSPWRNRAVESGGGGGGGGDTRTWWEKFEENVGAMGLPVDSDFLAGVSYDTLSKLVSTSESYKAAQEAINKSAQTEVEKRQMSLELMKQARAEAIAALDDNTVGGQAAWLEAINAPVDSDWVAGLTPQTAGLVGIMADRIDELRLETSALEANSVAARANIMEMKALTRTLEAAQAGSDTMKSAMASAMTAFLSGQTSFEDAIKSLLDTFTQTVIQKFTEAFTDTLWESLDLDSFFVKLFGGIDRKGEELGLKAAGSLPNMGGAPLSDKEGEGAGFLGGLSGIFSSFTSILSGLFGGLGKLFTSLFTSIGNLFSGGGGGGGFNWGSILSIFGFAEGGRIAGPGTGTSDSILAAVSNGEYVVNAKSTARWLPVLEAINSGGQLPRFASGGQVGAPAGALPAGGGFSNNNSQVFNVGVTGDISDQTKKEIYRLLPEIAAGVSSINRKKGN